jgi:hypothetical protein
MSNPICPISAHRLADDGLVIPDSYDSRFLHDRLERNRETFDALVSGDSERYFRLLHGDLGHERIVSVSAVMYAPSLVA